MTSFSERFGSGKKLIAAAESFPSINDMIRVLRIDKQITQVEVAEVMGCKQNYVSKVEAGISGISEERAQLFVEALGGPKNIENPYAWLIFEYMKVELQASKESARECP